MLQKIKRFIDKYKLIKKNDRILVALSGGPDSVFLVKVLIQLRNLYKINLYACHIDHQYRKESWKDSVFVKNFCKELNIPIVIEKIKIKKFSEEKARNLRYKIFERVASDFKCNKIATGHTLDDNSETVLMWITRGCGLKGLEGIPVKREKIIRPILCISKKEILNYLDKKRIKYCYDKTNLSLKFNRNKIRLKVIPVLEEINPRVKKHIFDLSEKLHIVDYPNNKINKVDTLSKKYYNNVNFNTFDGINQQGKKRRSVLTLSGVERVNYKEKTVYFDADKLDILKIKKRNWKDGDKMVPFGMTKSKKLQDIFVDEKIPKDLRKKIPVIIENNNIIWVAGVKRSNDAIVNDNTKKILKLEICN
ncbi:MAG: tRNA lysidine(34) synthetase TilS [Elusimicrobia bacterium RIFOXYD2_FULL_34_15]|nr:MAG: tRNA lysidine(34) synthetase TilS [Elusimicrobia bacterium RIFOXYD2_FULL_34_15]